MRTEYCGRIDTRHLDQTVTLMGWVNTRRDHGGVIFIDLRDREGIVQVVCNPDRKEVFAAAEKIRGEYVIKVVGKVIRREPNLVNPKIRSGEINAQQYEQLIDASAKLQALPLHRSSPELYRPDWRKLYGKM